MGAGGMNALQRIQLRNVVEKVLHMPGGLGGSMPEIALVCDYHMPREQLCARAAEIVDSLKRQSDIFRNVRLNVIKWVDDTHILKEISSMAYVRMGKVFQDYGQAGRSGGEKTLQELTRQLKLFYARSKLIIVITDGSYTVGEAVGVQENMQPFLHRKLLFIQGEKALMGTEVMRQIRQGIYKAENGRGDARGVVVFDMDGVLFDTERLYMDAWKAAADVHGIGDVTQVALGCVGLDERDSRKLFLDRFGQDFPFETFKKEAADFFQRKLEQDGPPMKPGVRELLEYLAERRFRIGLASSTRKERVLQEISKAGIAEYFEVVVGGDMVPRGKPQPDIYLAACRELEAEPERTYAIEDSANGIRAAHAAGMRPIMVPDLIQPDRQLRALACRVCQDLYEVKYYLAGRNIRRIPLEKLPNTRDLGGLPAAGGRQICPHRLLRSGALLWSSAADRAILLEEYGLKTVIDFRTALEREEKPDPKLEGVENIWNPILEEAVMGITREETGEKRGLVQQVLEQTGGDGRGPEEYMRNMYRNLVDEAYSRRQYRKFFEILLRQEEGAVLWHCTAGKDRVGVATALLLAALGTSREEILADYIKTNEFNAAEVEDILEKVKEEYRSAVRLLFVVKASYLESVFDRIEQAYGGMDAFLQKEMGLTPDRLDRLQEMYLL